MSYASLLSPPPLRPRLGPQLRRLPLQGGFGAEIRDLDLSAPLGDGTLGMLRNALAEDRLLLLRDQRLTPAQQVALTRRLGPAQAHPLDGAGVSELLIESGRVEDAAWHADLAYVAAPNRFSILQVADMGPVSGGIAFADQRAAHDRLDPWLAHAIEYLEIEHDPARLGTFALPRVTHPLVRVDPATGRRSLFVDARTVDRIPGVSTAESARLLGRLRDAATAPEVTWRHAWRPGDVLLWDNHALLHRIEAGPAGRAPRLLRSMVAGGPVLGPAATTTPWVVAG